MNISTEQMHAVMGGARSIRWSAIERAAGPVEVPEWCIGAHVYWMDEYSNPPDVRLKVRGDVRDWEGKTFTCAKGLYQAKHSDGRMEQYKHDGPVSLVPLQQFRSADGTIRHDRRYGPEWGNEPGFGTIMDGVRSGSEPGEFVEVECLATTRQEGFGGSPIWVTMDDGREICLRGPWHVGAPEGYCETAFVNMDDAWSRRVNHDRPWWKWVARGGLYVPHDLMIRILSTFLPHLELAWVDYGYAKGIEPLKPEWDAPKSIIHDRAWQARQSEREAAKAGAA